MEKAASRLPEDWTARKLFSLLEGEINLRVKPKDALKVLAVLLIVIIVFFVGRASVSEQSNEVSVRGFIAEPEAGEAEHSVPDTQPDVKEKNEPEPEEEIVQEYQDVILTLEDVVTDWQATWGKIVGLNVSIRNGENGSIRTDHIAMMVEGYTGVERRIPFKHTFRSGKAYVVSTPIPGGFDYNEATAGNLKEVDIILILYDPAGSIIASFRGDADLHGEVQPQ